MPWMVYSAVGAAGLLLGLAAAAAGPGGGAGGPGGRTPGGPGQRTVLLAHQSVGMNVLQGVERLVAAGGGGPRVVEVAVGAPVPPGALGHLWVGENTRPETKLAAFAQAVDALPPPGVDVALVKLCYVDFSAGTDARALFDQYRATLAALALRHPRTTFVHVTAPLSGVQGGLTGLAKRALGRSPYGLVENVRREEYNALLRAAYQGREPIFDLARVESTAPDGRGETVSWQGRTVPSLVPAYSEDGGHLNVEGQGRAARALLEVLAGLPERPGSGPVPR